MSRDQLIRTLQGAYSGELAASHAYDGHAKSVVDPEEKRDILVIRAEELEHRHAVGVMLSSLGAGPSARREWVMTLIGKTIGLLCRIGGQAFWYVSMYGAGRLELSNIGEYEVAARHARAIGRDDLAPALLAMAGVEWEHEAYFRRKIEGHWLARVLKPWRAPDAKAQIWESFGLSEPLAATEFPYRRTASRASSSGPY